MREIKFRAWDSNLKKFLNYPLRVNHFNFQEFECFDRQFNAVEEGIIFEQYTGLKDKNGREIYEGDIVRGEYYDIDYMSYKSVICPVNWIERSACFNIGSQYWNMESIIVVGNIKENPELI